MEKELMKKELSGLDFFVCEEGNFNKTHPELQKGEVFLKNGRLNEINHFNLKTLRPGKVAYRSNGKAGGVGYFPLFVQESEFEERRKE
ncbi:MAG: hypothetical protein ABIE46_00330 [Patescibacteria group bacterium]